MSTVSFPSPASHIRYPSPRGVLWNFFYICVNSQSSSFIYYYSRWWDTSFPNCILIIFQVKVLINVGGTDLNGTVRLLVKKLLRRSIAMQYSFEGRQGEKPFCQLILCKAVFGKFLNWIKRIISIPFNIIKHIVQLRIYFLTIAVLGASKVNTIFCK